ncbi:MAG: BatA domain-containing protein [Planctomycetes bacterium]|nr:BatA domain-containing protein [Planctomycetota bacterium]
MLEFAREQWLWLFALVGVFYVAWWFARRYRKQRVTYGRIWQRVAKRVLPPGWKRVLRTALTLLISGVLLSSVVLYAAGLQRPKDEQPAPLLVFIVLDNAPAMRVRSEGRTRAQLANERAQQIVDALGKNDRALLAWRKNGQLLTGHWLKTGDDVGDPPPTDWIEVTDDNWAVDLSGIPAPPDIPLEPPAQRLALQIAGSGGRAGGMPEFLISGDSPPPRFANIETQWFSAFGVPTCFETVGEPGSNNGFTNAEFIRPEPGDGTSGRIKFSTRDLGDVTAVDTVSGRTLAVTSGEVILPVQGEPMEVRLSVGEGDSLPEDNTLRMQLNPHGLAKVVLCHPPDGEGPNTILRDTLAYLLPGRDIETRAVQPGDDIKADLLVCDRVVPDQWSARYLLCFGTIPPSLGQTGDPFDVSPGLQLSVDTPKDLGFEVPQLTLLHGTDAVPLGNDATLAPLAKGIGGETLVAIKRGQPEVLYVGFLPHRSTLLQDSAGLLLLLRWLNAIQSNERIVFPPFIARGSEAEFQLDQQSELSIRLSDDNPWLPSFGPKAFRLTTGADGRGKLGPFTIPGEYVIERSGQEIARFTVVWASDADLRWPASFRIDLDLLFAESIQPDWRDYLPGALLWVALALLVLEWLLWLVGVTE